MRSKIVIVDYGSSNLRSVAKAFAHVTAGAHDIEIANSADRIAAADRVVFPGQGAIGDCMGRLNALGIVDTLRTCMRTRPFLGICLGLQSLMDWSDEDAGTECLAMVPGNVVRFTGSVEPATGRRWKIPHMGWNEVHQARQHPLWQDIDSGARFYFVHSYYVAPEIDGVVAARTRYITEFVSAIATGKVFATQFHPEKSQQAGLTLIRNFVRWSGAV